MSLSPVLHPIDRSGFDRENAAFVAAADVGRDARIVEFACGAGGLTRHLLERHPEAALCAVDVDAVALERCRRMLGDRGIEPVDLDIWRSPRRRGRGGKAASACLLRQDATQRLPLDEGEVDLVIMGNAIHLIGNADDLIGEAWRILRPGGLLAFNTAFFAGTYPPGTEGVWAEWRRQALAMLSIRGGLSQPPGQTMANGVPADPGWLSPEAWEDRAAAQGFADVRHRLRDCPLRPGGLALMATLPGVAELVLPEAPRESALQALIASAPRCFEALGIEHPVSRLWLEVEARKG